MCCSACDQWRHVILRCVDLVSPIVPREMIIIIVVMILIGYYTTSILWIQQCIRIVEVLCRIGVLVNH
jgi:hypothetical protein